MKQLYIKIINFIYSPISSNLHWFLIILLLSTTFDAIQFFRNELFGIFLAIVSGKLITSYILTIPIAINNKWIKYLYISILMFLIGIFFLIDAFCVSNLNVSFNRNFVAMIKGSNPTEASEFFNNYGILNIVIYLSVAIVASIGIFVFVKKVKLKKWGHWLIIPTIILLGINSIRTYECWKNFSLFGKCLLFSTESEYYNYRDFYSSPKLKTHHKNAPQNLVIIIGESLSRQHCELFGYPIKNQPYLSEFKRDSLLFLFDNVNAADVGTMANFKCFMSTYNPKTSTTKKWYECTTFLEILEMKDYYTHWISNHSKTGFADNIIGRYADLCDTTYFNNWFNSAYDTRLKYDESLIEPLANLKTQSTNKYNTYICHLMGSHYTFSSRYPESFNRFKPNNYNFLPTNQRQNISEYDNSVLYNDFVVSSIINLFSKDDAIVIYFSDHGLDLYHSGPNYCGHSTTPKGNEYAIKIPFMIYTSKTYQQKHPEIIKKFIQNEHTYFCTTNLIYTIMDIIGVDFECNPCVKTHTLLQ